MSDTPRTDAHLADAVRLTSLYSAHPDFARVLERENAALRARLAEVERERDEAKANCNALMNQDEYPCRLELVIRDNARLRADKERLDFVEAHPEIGLGSSRPSVRIVGFSPCAENGWRAMEFKAETYRAALDAARASLAQTEADKS